MIDIDVIKTKSPKTSKLMRLTNESVVFRLSAADRVFLNDLARVQIISSDLADKHHYNHLKGASKGSLERLEKAGLITSKTLFGNNPVKVYQFADQTIAGTFHGKLPVTGAKRNDLHELMSTRVFFALGKPESFKLASSFTKSEISRCGSLRPDAIYTDQSGELVAVEADSGHYNQSQINTKITRWRAAGITKQVWAQPANSSCENVPALPGINVMRF